MIINPNIISQQNQTPAEQAANYAKMKTTMLYQTVDRMHRELCQFIWQNPAKVPVMDILVAYGKDAKSLWDASVAIQTLLVAIGGDIYKPFTPPQVIEFNDEGSVIKP